MNLFLESLNKHNIHQIMQLKIYTEDPDLKLEYLQAIESHNQKMQQDMPFIDAGFDLFCPEQIITSQYEHIIKMDLKIKCCAQILTLKEDRITGQFTGFDLVARSSMSNSPFRMANQIGIIDAGYNGNLSAVLDNFKFYENYPTSYHNQNKIVWKEPYIKKYQKLLQICAPTRCPIWVELVENVSELENNASNRGQGGFGSTN